VDVDMIKNGLAAMLYFENPSKVGGKQVAFKDLDEKVKKEFLTKAGKVVSHLDKLNLTVISKSAGKQIKDVGQERIKLIASVLKKRLSVLKRPANLMDFVNDNVIEEVAIAVNIELINAE